MTTDFSLTGDLEKMKGNMRNLIKLRKLSRDISLGRTSTDDIENESLKRNIRLQNKKMLS